jgi:hypothetical protein
MYSTESSNVKTKLKCKKKVPTYIIIIIIIQFFFGGVKMSVKIKPGWNKEIIIEPLFHNFWKSYIPAIIRFQASTQCIKTATNLQKVTHVMVCCCCQVNQSCRTTTKETTTKKFVLASGIK